MTETEKKEAEIAFTRRLIEKDVTAVKELLEWTRVHRPLSVTISRIEYDLKEYADSPNKLCDYTVRYSLNACPKCASQNTSVKNYNMMWHDGDITCDDCGEYVRMYDAG